MDLSRELSLLHYVSDQPAIKLAPYFCWVILKIWGKNHLQSYCNFYHHVGSGSYMANLVERVLLIALSGFPLGHHCRFLLFINIVLLLHSHASHLRVAFANKLTCKNRPPKLGKILSWKRGCSWFTRGDSSWIYSDCVEVYRFFCTVSPTNYKKMNLSQYVRHRASILKERNQPFSFVEMGVNS